jgi:plastocyanin
VRGGLAVVLGAAAVLAGAGAAHAQTLYGSIQGGAIGLRDASGASVTSVTAGTYTFEVTDTETIHNFHLLGTAVDTPIDGTGTFTYPGIALAEGFYSYVCDIHPELNGTFSVGSPPPRTAPASVASVSVTRARGFRFVAISFRVESLATARVALQRGSRRVATVSSHLLPGRRTVRIRVPRTTVAGVYAVRIRLSDAATGAVFSIVRQARIPRA